MVPSGASGASSSEVSVNQAPLLPALQPQPPAAELDGGAANANNNIGVVPPAIPAESAASNNPNQPILDAPPLQEGDRASQNNAPPQREQFLSALETLNKRLRDLFLESGNPLRWNSLCQK